MLGMRIRRKDLISDIVEHACKYLLHYFKVSYDDNTKGIVLMGKLNDIFESWKKKINEIEEIISEHQRQQLEKDKEEEARLEKLAVSSQDKDKSATSSQKEGEGEGENENENQNTDTPFECKPVPQEEKSSRDEPTFEDIELQKQEDELEDLLEQKQSQEIVPNHMERDHRGRKIPQFTERFRKEYVYIMIMADFFK